MLCEIMFVVYVFNKQNSKINNIYILMNEPVKDYVVNLLILNSAVISLPVQAPSLIQSSCSFKKS